MNTQTDVPRQSTTSLSRSRRRILPADAVVTAAVIVVARADRKMPQPAGGSGFP